MALIACLECTKEISDKATACPHCGNPMQYVPAPMVEHAASSAAHTIEGVVVTEQTSKPWKTMQMVGVVLMVLGFASCMSGSYPFFAGVTLSGLGAVVTICGRIGAWWGHG